jgi:hypothetical protein
LVIVRVGLGISSEQAESERDPVGFSPTGARTSITSSEPTLWSRNTAQQKPAVSEYPLQPLEVEVTTIKHIDKLSGYNEP